MEPLETIDVTRDPGMARAIRDMLGEVAETDDDPIKREIAREVLGGRLRMSEIATYSAYREALHRSVDEIGQWRDGLSDEELAALAERGRAHFARLRTEEQGDRP